MICLAACPVRKSTEDCAKSVDRDRNRMLRRFMIIEFKKVPPQYNNHRRIETSAGFSFHSLPDVELQLPSPAVAGHGPKLQHACLRHNRFQGDGNKLTGLAGGVARLANSVSFLVNGVSFLVNGPECNLHRRKLFQFFVHLVQHRTRGIVLANRRLKEAKLRRLADNQTEFAAAQIDGSAFLHTKRCYGKRLHGCAHTGNRGQRTFDPDIVSARYAAANPYAATRSSQSVVSRSPRHGEHQVLPEQGRGRGQTLPGT